MHYGIITLASRVFMITTVAISEGYIAYLLKYDIAVVKEKLRKLHIDRVIIYEPKKKTRR